jgi:hypothetical protein
MMSAGDVLLTASDLLKWREEDQQLDEKIRQMQQRRADLKRKLEAAEVFAEPVATPAAAAAPEPATPAAHGADEESETPPQAFLANMRKTGDSLNIKQIRQRLIELGFGDRIKTQPNYHYQLVYRLARGNKLLKRGSKYRAAPTVLPEGETEAVGASVQS